MFHPRILVVTSCTGEKRFKPENQLQLDDFKNPVLLQSRSAELAEYVCPAGQMYTGSQHLRLMEGMSILRQNRVAETIDLSILSAAYGLIGEDEKIVPYEVTFNTMTSEEVDRWATTLNIHIDFEKKTQVYDLIFVLLGEQYLRSLKLPVNNRDGQSTIFLTSTGSLKYLKASQTKNIALILSNIQAKHYGYGLVGLKGFLFKKFAEAVVQNSTILTEVYEHPELFSQIIENRAIQLNIPIKADDLVEIPTVESIRVIDLKQYQNNSIGSGRSETAREISIPDVKITADYSFIP